MTTLYVKQGRKYVPYAETFERELMKVGQFRLAYCYQKGGHRYCYDVTPDTAGFVAAAMVAEQAMEKAIKEAAKPIPHPHPEPFTPEQLAIIERFREEMQAAGALLPRWWTHLSPTEVAEAGINAVRKYAP